MTSTKKIFGIDSLYYFCESNENYDDYYIEMLDQVEEVKGNFEKKDIEFENNDIHINLNDIPLNFLGRAEGYHWFKDINDYFKIGFKDKYKNRGLNDIRVQLLGIGIYTIGIKSLIDFINNILLKDVVTGYYPITRADLNCFIQYDFSFVTKEMFVSRKKQYSTISEIGSSTQLQTIYVGKEPFKLRLYNKKEELKKSRKKDLMYEYFANNDFDLEADIFNVEFEMHRSYLKTFSILTIEDLLTNAVNLFKSSMDDIRLIDITTLSENAVEHNNKHRGETLAIWEEIKQEYELKDFLQIQLPLTKVKRAVSVYDDYKFKLEYIALIRRALVNRLNINTDYLEELYQEGKESLNKTQTNTSMKKRYTEVEIIDKEGNIEKFRLLEDGNLIKPLSIETVANLQNYDLLTYLDKVREKQNLSTKNKHIYEVALKEAMKRGLVLDISPHEANERY
ncbi:hypothetical protein [Poseidonibacter antarcticus]|uniref:hypothetical protein n=1 Tax=Poseidonibacter antarcticus TaxID=2478538 RepID=UPI000EF4ACCD|nr:hypothetical protein [Poseidonibacter antarcticus]